MTTDTLILIIGAAALLALGGLAWAHQHRRKDHARKQRDAEHAARFAERRDVIPYLIEAYRTVVPPKNVSDIIEKIIRQRAAARDAKGFESLCQKERLLEEYLNALFEETDGNPDLEKNLSWLEARTELRKMFDSASSAT